MNRGDLSVYECLTVPGPASALVRLNDDPAGSTKYTVCGYIYDAPRKMLREWLPQGPCWSAFDSLEKTSHTLSV